MKRLLITLIQLYQRTLSPDHGIGRRFRVFGCCKFYPTCSEYTIQAIKKYSLPRALYASGKRLLRCNPFSFGGADKA